MTTLHDGGAPALNENGSAWGGRDPALPLSRNSHLLKWVEKMARLTQPAAIHWVDGTWEEYVTLCARMVQGGTFIKLNQELWPGCYLARSDPSDVARVEARTFICSFSREAAGPTNNWEDPYKMRRKLQGLFSGSMRGRTMYVLPFSMGPVGSPMSQIGVQLTDSPYVVVSMRIMARIGLPVFNEIDESEKRVVPCMHTLGAPLRPVAATCPGPATRKSTSSTSRRLARSGPLAPAMAATRCSARSASPCGSPRTLLETRAGWPSICSFSASRILRAKRPTSPRRFPRHAARRTSPC